MMEPGTLACTAMGGLIVHVEVEHYRIAPEDVRSLIFAGRPAPVTQERVQRTGGIIVERPGGDTMSSRPER